METQSTVDRYGHVTLSMNINGCHHLSTDVPRDLSRVTIAEVCLQVRMLTLVSLLTGIFLVELVPRTLFGFVY